jgi:predicted TIM-barrel fold metal-dependent hydrolase
MIIDIHSSIIPDDTETKTRLGITTEYYDQCTVTQQLRRMAENGIDSAVVWTAIPFDSEWVMARNQWLAEEIAKHQGKFIGFAALYPMDLKESLKALEQAIIKLGLSGIKVHPLAQQFRFNDPKFIELVKEIATLDVPLVIHVDMREPGLKDREEVTEWAKPEFLLDVLTVYDSPNVMAAHMGGILVEEIRNSKISFQTTGVQKETIEYACQQVGAERVLFGSDFPSFQVEEEIRKVHKANISPEEREMIFSGNAKKMFNI